MQALSKAKVGGNYTIQWLFGLPEVVEFLHRHHVEEGGSVQVIQKLSNGLIIGANGERFAMSMAKKNIDIFKDNPKKDEPLGDEKHHYEI